MFLYSSIHLRINLSRRWKCCHNYHKDYFSALRKHNTKIYSSQCKYRNITFKLKCHYIKAYFT